MVVNSFLNGLKNETNFTLTENGAVTHKSTCNSVLDMFAMGGAYRNRSESDCIVLFKNAFQENQSLALKCLFYLRDVRGGQGERRFFRICLKWLANNYPLIAERLLPFIPEFGRWDDLYAFEDTLIESDMFNFMKNQLALDIQSLEIPNASVSLLGKWLKSCNASSYETRRLGMMTAKAFGLTAKQYRKILSMLRTRIGIVEKLMSENRWDEIEFDKVPSRAGLIYKNAFARMEAERYEQFVKDKSTKFNTQTLYPYEVVSKALKVYNDIDRATVNKYWDNLENYFNKAEFDGIAVIDTSQSMTWTRNALPLRVAISLGLYCAEKASGPFKDHFITFSQTPNLVKTEGADFVDKVNRIFTNTIIDNTNIEAVFDLLLDTAIKNHCPKEDIPKNIIIISDMEFDEAIDEDLTEFHTTIMESIRNKWKSQGYDMPHLIFWNVDARQNNIPMIGDEPISYVSGFSPIIFKSIMSGKTGIELMYETLLSERYKDIN